MGFRKVAKCMIQNEFEDLGGAVAKATRKRNTRFVVQALDHTTVILAFGAHDGLKSGSESGRKEVRVQSGVLILESEAYPRASPILVKPRAKKNLQGDNRRGQRQQQEPPASRGITRPHFAKKN